MFGDRGKNENLNIDTGHPVFEGYDGVEAGSRRLIRRLLDVTKTSEN
jgi:hypothetical protein